MTDDIKPDPIPDGEDEGSDSVPAEGEPQTITITEPTIIVPDDEEDPA